jgi:hypothetical protein
MERPPPRGFAKRDAVPGPLWALRRIRSAYVFSEVKAGKAPFLIDSSGFL